MISRIIWLMIMSTAPDNNRSIRISNKQLSDTEMQTPACVKEINVPSLPSHHLMNAGFTFTTWGVTETLCAQRAALTKEVTVSLCRCAFSIKLEHTRAQRELIFSSFPFIFRHFLDTSARSLIFCHFEKPYNTRWSYNKNLQMKQHLASGFTELLWVSVDLFHWVAHSPNKA